VKEPHRLLASTTRSPPRPVEMETDPTVLAGDRRSGRRSGANPTTLAGGRLSERQSGGGSGRTRRWKGAALAEGEGGAM
jgi:hypothetical protein